MNRYIAILALLFAGACDDFSIEERGDLGETCFGNGTCKETLSCIDGLCVTAGGGDTDLMFPDDAQTDDAAMSDQSDSSDQSDDAATDDDTVTPDVDTLPENACNEGEICWFIIDTVQTACYNLTGSVSCPQEGSQFYGQDGNYSGAGREFQSRTTSGPTLIDDNQTKLTWQKTLDGTARSWSDAEAYCAGLAGSSYGDRTDWRLPTRQELLSLLAFDANSVDPLIDEFYFPATPADTFWTGTDHGYNYYYVDFSGDGMSYSDPGETLHQVRCVSSPWNYLSARPIPRWIETTVGSDAIVEDSLTGLVWRPDFTGDTTLLWTDALAYCAALNYAQKSDWRLPDVNEMQSLITTGAEPEHVSTFPDMTEDYFWTSTTNAKDISKVWLVEFRYGIIRPDMAKDTNANGIRTICVRNKD